MGKLRDLIEERTRTFAEYNSKILEAIQDNVLPAVLDMLELSDNEQDKLEWSHIQLLKDQLVINGVIKYKEGDVISDGDMTVTLDASMALLLDKLVRVSVPIDLAETGSATDIVEHLKDSQRQLRKDYERAYGHEPESIEEAMEAAFREYPTEFTPLKDHAFDFGPDFDYNGLTEEQKEALYTTMIGQGTGDREKPN